MRNVSSRQMFVFTASIFSVLVLISLWFIRGSFTQMWSDLFWVATHPYYGGLGAALLAVGMLACHVYWRSIVNQID